MELAGIELYRSCHYTMFWYIFHCLVTFGNFMPYYLLWLFCLSLSLLNSGLLYILNFEHYSGAYRVDMKYVYPYLYCQESSQHSLSFQLWKSRFHKVETFLTGIFHNQVLLKMFLLFSEPQNNALASHLNLKPEYTLLNLISFLEDMVQLVNLTGYYYLL